ncbi:hypothetical protein QGN29_04050 [Temperatibacter marinus]|uniref:Uncharacterized protein n=1 Tax=Temperatibacter marinus TaxID=1456591 RepID=A0AA52EJA5_9PROT|nr:hypothetical protein [Temperatibacter marinus]WND03544.1 hypothetical protein QGN29_04050 [Temperatibacter marinus]
MTYLFLTFAILYLILLIQSFRFLPSSARVWFLRALMISLMYDNMVVGLGTQLQEAGTLPFFSYGRVCLHATVLPFLSFFTFSTLKTYKTESTVLMPLGLLLTGAALYYGVTHEIMGLTMDTKTVLGITRMVDNSGIPPIATIATNFITIGAAVMIWRAAGSKFLLYGAGFIFIINGATATLEWGFAAGACAEVIFLLSLLRTEKATLTRKTSE